MRRDAHKLQRTTYKKTVLHTNDLFRKRFTYLSVNNVTLARVEASRKPSTIFMVLSPTSPRIMDYVILLKLAKFIF